MGSTLKRNALQPHTERAHQRLQRAREHDPALGGAAVNHGQPVRVREGFHPIKVGRRRSVALGEFGAAQVAAISHRRGHPRPGRGQRAARTDQHGDARAFLRIDRAELFRAGKWFSLGAGQRHGPPRLRGRHTAGGPR